MENQPSVAAFATHAYSRRDCLRLIGGLTATALLTGCRPPSFTPSPSAQPTGPPIPTPTPSTAPTASPSGIGLADKIGQMLMVGFRGLEVSADHFIVRDIRQRNLGGVVLFDYDVPSQTAQRNVESPAQLQALVGSLQAAAEMAVAETPLLVAIDHEGGALTRLRETYGFPATLSHQALGELDDVEVTRAQANGMARTLAEAGINLNLAPVVDLNLNPDNPIIARYERSFSADPQVVVRHARAFIQAHHVHGVRCAIKHFPGHGSSSGDTHAGWVDVSQTWSWQELLPFTQLIEADLADAVMTAHVFNADFDARDPATLSAKTIGGLLRGKLAYDGVVISDDLQMGAIRQHYGFETAVRKAVEAGVDILAFANNSVYEEDVTARAIALITRLIEEGAISQARVERSYRRIQQIKETLT